MPVVVKEEQSFKYGRMEESKEEDDNDGFTV
jgi:hypothetical protein